MLTLESQADRNVADELRAYVWGGVALPSDQTYADACRVWNGAVHRRPAIIAFCERAEDVQAAVRVARRHGLPLSVRGGGHDWAGRALHDGGLVLDLTGMRDVAVDPQVRIATVAGGARVKEACICVRLTLRARPNPPAFALIKSTRASGCPLLRVDMKDHRYDYAFSYGRSVAGSCSQWSSHGPSSSATSRMIYYRTKRHRALAL